MQAAWVLFAETGQARILCILQPTLLTTCTLDGELQTVPNVEKFTRLWPLCRGLLLTVSTCVAWCCEVLRIASTLSGIFLKEFAVRC